MPEDAKPADRPETTPAKEVLSTVVGLTVALKEVASELALVRNELRRLNQLELEKMKFNQFMDTMRSEYGKLVKRLAKEMGIHGKEGKNQAPGK